jgi:hypothetical protein
MDMSIFFYRVLLRRCMPSSEVSQRVRQQMEGRRLDQDQEIFRQIRHRHAARALPVGPETPASFSSRRS